MPPKKKGRKKNTPIGVVLSQKELQKNLLAQVSILQHKIDDKERESNLAVREQTEIQQDFANLEQEYEKTKDSTQAIACDLSRQYKAHQENMLNEIHRLENLLSEQEKTIENQTSELEEVHKSKEETLVPIVKKINELSHQNKLMNIHFKKLILEVLSNLEDVPKLTPDAVGTADGAERSNNN
eukprot:Platyproteum_vivax@DN14667_c0_g1_i1.p1